MTTRELAHISGVSQPTVWRAIAGRGTPRRRNRLLISGALGVPVEQLFPVNPNS